MITRKRSGAESFPPILRILAVCFICGGVVAAIGWEPIVALGSSRRDNAGVVMFRLTEAAFSKVNSRLRLPTGSSVSCDVSSVDRVLAEYDVVSISALSCQPKNRVLAKTLGLDRDLLAYVDGSADGEALVADLESLADIEFAEVSRIPTFLMIPNDPLYASNWGHNNQAQLPKYTYPSLCPPPEGDNFCGPLVGMTGFDADADVAWDLPQHYGASSIILAILDTGCDTEHPDLRLVSGYDFVQNDSNPDDEDGHGTNCAGVAAAIANNGIGAVGIAGGCSIMPVRVGHEFQVRDGLIWAANNGAHIISMSFASTNNEFVHAAIRYADSMGVLMFAAAGNDGSPEVVYPALYSEVIAVGAASPCGQRHGANSCVGAGNPSNFGPNLDLLAPIFLPTTDILGPGGYNLLASPEGDYLKHFGGTSCAAPYAAGVAALLLSAEPGLTKAQVETRLRTTARDVKLGGATCGFDTQSGYGLVNARTALLGIGYPCCDLPGDVNNSGSVTIGDVIYLNNYVFASGPPPPCLNEGDVNANCAITSSDVMYLRNYVVGGGPAPACGP